MTPITKFTPTTGATEGFEVAFETNKAVSGSVFVPTAQIHDTSAVAYAINNRVEQLHAIQSLTG
jgi:hypothetical protein